MSSLRLAAADDLRGIGQTSATNPDQRRRTVVARDERARAPIPEEQWRVSAYFRALWRRSQIMTTVEERTINGRVTDCPARDCDGQALITYEAHAFRSPAVRIIADIACDREGCQHFASTDAVAAVLGSDPRSARVPVLQ